MLNPENVLGLIRGQIRPRCPHYRDPKTCPACDLERVIAHDARRSRAASAGPWTESDAADYEREISKEG